MRAYSRDWKAAFVFGRRIVVPIRVMCHCKRFMVLPDKYAGQHVQCPDCRAMLRIPTEKEDRELTRWFCSCGQRLKARARSAGLKVTCPRCKAETTVPLPEKYETFIEEKFALDATSGIVQLAPPGTVQEPSVREIRHEPAEKTESKEDVTASEAIQPGQSLLTDSDVTEENGAADPGSDKTLLETDDSEATEPAKDDSDTNLCGIGARRS